MTEPRQQGMPQELLSQAAEFWKQADRRFERTPQPEIADRDMPLCAWGMPGAAIVLPQPHYRIVVPNNYRVFGWAITADQPGNLTVRVEWSPFMPVASYVDATGGASPTLVGVQNVLTLDLPTWTHKNLMLYDLLHVYLGSVDGVIQEAMFHLFVRVMAKPQGLVTTVDAAGNVVVDAAGNVVITRH